MFRYIRIDFVEMERIPDDTDLSDELVDEQMYILGNYLDPEEEEHVYKLKMDKRVFRTDAGLYRFSEYVYSRLPEYVERVKYIYIALKNYGDKFSIFIERDLFEISSEEDITEIIQSSEEEGILDFMKDEVELTFLKSPILYELTGEASQAFGHQILTEEFFFVLNPQQYIIHKEPLLYRFSKNGLLLMTMSDYQNDMIRLLEINEEFECIQKDRVPYDDLLDLVKEQNFTLKEVMEISDITKKINHAKEAEFLG